MRVLIENRKEIEAAMVLFSRAPCATRCTFYSFDMPTPPGPFGMSPMSSLYLDTKSAVYLFSVLYFYNVCLMFIVFECILCSLFEIYLVCKGEQ